MARSISLVGARNRQGTWDITILDADDNPCVISPQDTVRVKIGNELEMPILDIESGVTTSNGSTCSRANPTRLVLGAGDLSFSPGIYDIEVSVNDYSQNDTLKLVDKGIFHLLGTLDAS